MRRTALSAVAMLALTAVLTGCGDDSGSDDDSDESKAPVGALTAEQISTAVLQDDNLGEGWESEPATEDEDPAPGCLNDVEVLTEGLEEEAKGGTEFSHGETLTVESTVNAYADEVALKAVFEQVKTVVEACTEVTGPDADGNEWSLTLSFSDDVVEDDLDDQYSLSGSGDITTPGGDTIPIHVEQTAFRVGPNVGSVTTFDVQSRTTEHAAYAEIAIERLLDVAEGEEPESETAPAPA